MDRPTAEDEVPVPALVGAVAAIVKTVFRGVVRFDFKARRPAGRAVFAILGRPTSGASPPLDRSRCDARDLGPL